MSKAVLICNRQSIYDDLPEERYHFPRQYLNRLEQTVGDWIIYYESRRNGGRQEYYATAQVRNIRPDPNRSDHFYADIGHYLEFPNPVPFKIGNQYFETSLLRPDGSLNPGRVQSAIHPITDAEYQLIFQSGFANLLEEGTVTDRNNDFVSGFFEDQLPFHRPLIETILQRPFRDQAFRKSVLSAYHNQCAMTGLRILNGGGRPEAQAAHIQPVAAEGPDSVRNGIALSGTMHWMFDRGLISLNDDYKVLKAKSGLPKAIDRLLIPSEQIILPDHEEFRPHKRFLHYHQEHVFKG